jgi:DNA-binding HxlR family transcriptional regulator
MPAFRSRGKTWNNPVQLALDTIGGKWRMPILWRLKDGPLGYAALRRSLSRSLPTGTITDRAMTTQLRLLERHGLVTRTVHSTVPPRVDYAITPRGLAAIPCISALQTYGRQIMTWEGATTV